MRYNDIGRRVSFFFFQLCRVGKLKETLNARYFPRRDRKLVTNYRENRRIFPQECRVQEKYIPQGLLQRTFIERNGEHR